MSAHVERERHVERMCALQEAATDKMKDAVASIVATAIADENFDDGHADAHAQHLMVAVVIELFASMLEGLLDDENRGKAVLVAANSIVGPRLVDLHKRTKN